MRASRHRMRRSAALLFACMLALALPVSAFASAWDNDGDDHIDKEIQQQAASGSDDQGYAQMGKDIVGGNAQVNVSQNIDGNFLLSAQSLTIRKSKGANAFVAGQDLTVENSQFSGDIGAAGQTITITDTSADSNVFAAGQTITLNLGTTSTVNAAGQTVSLSAEHAESANVDADTVNLSGTYTGDVHVDASNVNIEQGTVVKGTLYVTSETEPSLPASSSINNYEFTKSDNSSGIGEVLSNPLAAGGALGALGIVVGVLGMLVLMAAMLGACSDRPFIGSLNMVKQRTVPMLVSGLVAFIAIPPVALLCLITIAGWRVGAVVALGTFIVATLSGTFTAISLGRLAFPKMNKWLSSLIMVLIFALLLKVPVLGMILGACCDIYLLGYLVQLFWIWRTHLNDEPQQHTTALPPEQQ